MDGRGATHAWTTGGNVRLDTGDELFEKLEVFESQTRFVIFGYNQRKKHWRLLKIDRTEPDELNITEDPTEYTDGDRWDILARLSEGNKMTGGINLLTRAYGIVGFVKFLCGYYMVVVKEREQVGNICGHLVYRIVDTQMILVPHPVYITNANNKAEPRYKKLFMLVDLTRDFFFSYTYPIMHCLQRNALASPEERCMSYESMYVWNAFLSRQLRQAVGNSMWTVAIVHGFFKQNKCSLNGRIAVVTLIARRSRHFAGTRYLKRGVNDKGKVANDVETEQILADDDAAAGMASGQITSAVQNRGSIPLFWSQQATQLTPKPDIVLQRYDPVYAATALHFKDLENRYGNPIVILNLIKTVEKKPREMILRRGYKQAIDYLNEILENDKQLKFIHSDYNQMAKSKSGNVLNFLQEVASACLDKVGFFYSGKLNPDVRREINRQRRQRLGLQSSRMLGTHHFLHVQPVPASMSTTTIREMGSERHGIIGNGGDGDDDAVPESPERGRSLSGLVEFVASSTSAQEIGAAASLSPTASTMSEHSEARASDDTFASISTSQSHDPLIHPQPGSPSRGTSLNITPKHYAKHPTFQNGVLRTNCIDCLDRTNVAQYAYGMCSLGRQLVALGLADEATVDPDSKVAAMLIDAYTEMGDSLAIQYGGSAAHNTVLSERQGKWTPTVQSDDLLKSIKRYISNVISDKDKQDGMNLFLGHFLPKEGKPAIWELESDYYLHVRSIETEDDTPMTGIRAEHLGSHLHIPALSQEDLVIPEPPFHLELTSIDDLIKQRCGDLRQVSTYKDDAAGPSSPHLPLIEPLASENVEHSPTWVGYRTMEDADSESSNEEEEMQQQAVDEDELALFYDRYVNMEGLDATDEDDDGGQCYDCCQQSPMLYLSEEAEDYYVGAPQAMDTLSTDDVPECFRQFATVIGNTSLDPDTDYDIHVAIPEYACTTSTCPPLNIPPAPHPPNPQESRPVAAPQAADGVQSTDYTTYLTSWLIGNAPG